MSHESTLHRALLPEVATAPRAGVLGATGYEELTTVDEEVHPTFLAAAVSSGLLEADAELSKAMEEAALFKFGDDLRRLFVNQLIFNMLLDSLTLFNKHKSVNGNFKRIVISSSLSVIT